MFRPVSSYISYDATAPLRSPRPPTVPKLSRSGEIRACVGQLPIHLDNVDPTAETTPPTTPAPSSPPFPGTRRPPRGVRADVTASHRRGSPLPSPPRLPGHRTGLAIPAQSRAQLPAAPAAAPAATPAAAPTVDLARFNTAPAADAERTLLTCCRSLRWARRIAACRPYPDLDSLLAAADEAAYDLTPGDLAEALAGESLPPLPDDTYGAAHTALSAAGAAYEARFGHVFVTCLDDTPPGEALDHVLTTLRSRLANDPEEERVVVAEELRRLARGRVTRLLRTIAPL
ncbi:Oxo-4-hydroxy-4-carboxy-5-ureidoimidazoline decarboxylase [Actinobacteria bacterium OK074]|nr:Oxo-4-hydroxy-4-carboxy-5-ureidoimidazoline decarboxylase [Actinobacteria bacterium OK074]